MTILDVKSMIDIERFRKINIRAQKAADVYAAMDLSPQSNVDFLKRCAHWIPVINFADYETGEIYARLQGGKWIWRNEQRFERALDNPDARAGLLAVARIYAPAAGTGQKPTDVGTEKMYTLGAWGGAVLRPSDQTTSGLAKNKVPGIGVS